MFAAFVLVAQLSNWVKLKEVFRPSPPARAHGSKVVFPTNFRRPSQLNFGGRQCIVPCCSAISDRLLTRTQHWLAAWLPGGPTSGRVRRKRAARRPTRTTGVRAGCLSRARKARCVRTHTHTHTHIVHRIRERTSSQRGKTQARTSTPTLQNVSALFSRSAHVFQGKKPHLQTPLYCQVPQNFSYLKGHFLQREVQFFFKWTR